MNLGTKFENFEVNVNIKVIKIGFNVTFILRSIKWSYLLLTQSFKLASAKLLPQVA